MRAAVSALMTTESAFLQGQSRKQAEIAIAGPMNAALD
jgi:hypothetical protein